MSHCGNKNEMSQFKRGFNNKYICFQYPFTWKDIKSEKDEEHVNAVLFNKENNVIVKISTNPCITNTIKELKEEVENNLKSKEYEIKETGIESTEDHGIWDIIYKTNEGLEIEQYSILKDNNLYTLELYTKNRNQTIVKTFVDIIQSFKILKPSYKITNGTYEKI